MFSQQHQEKGNQSVLLWNSVHFFIFFIFKIVRAFCITQHAKHTNRPSGITLKSMQNLDAELSQNIHLIWLNNKTRGLCTIHCERQDSFAPAQTVWRLTAVSFIFFWCYASRRSQNRKILKMWLHQIFLSAGLICYMSNFQMQSRKCCSRLSVQWDLVSPAVDILWLLENKLSSRTAYLFLKGSYRD